MKLYQITDDDLATLERDLPAFVSRHMESLDNTDRSAIRRMQKIISNVRWNYGPPTDVERIDAQEPPHDPQ